MQVVSTSATYSNPSGASSTSIYADACGWKRRHAGLRRTGEHFRRKSRRPDRRDLHDQGDFTGTATLRARIYDFSGASYHYNSDFDAVTLTPTPLTVRYELATTIAGDGKVTSSPAGTLTSGSSSGIDCGGTGTSCSVGYGTGSVSSDVGAIDCGSICGDDYDAGTEVTLTATTSPDSRFSGWSGACTGSGTCTVTMSQARNVTADFVTVHTLTVTKTGSGSVTGAAIDCGATCSVDYDDGTDVTLTATASGGSHFTGWSGACTGSGTCTVTMSQARNVRAIFVTVNTLTAPRAARGPAPSPATASTAAPPASPTTTTAPRSRSPLLPPPAPASAGGRAHAPAAAAAPSR